MSWRAVGTIYAKELRDLLRDRRTLVSTIVIPTFIMPALMLVVGRMASAIVSKARAEIPRIMVIGGDDSPGIRAELEEDGQVQGRASRPPTGRPSSPTRGSAPRSRSPRGFERALGSGSAPAVTLYDYQGELKSGLAVRAS
jgi:sodium transport system permease protein